MSESPYTAPEDEKTETLGERSNIKVYAALTMVLGIFGLLGMCLGCGGVTLSPFMSSLGLDMTGTMSTAQADAYEDLMAASMRLMPLTILSLIAGTVTALLVFLGGALALAEHGKGVRMLKLAMITALIVDPARFLLQLISQLLIREQSAAYMATATNAPGLPPELQSMMSTIMAVSITLGILLSATWLLIKVVLYALTLQAARHH